MSQKQQFNCVEHIPTDTADNFLDYLDLRNDFWGTKLKCPWVFRGQGDASFGLLPKAWRQESYQLLRSTMSSLKPTAEKQWESVYKYSYAKGHEKNHAIEVLTHTASVFELTYRFVELADELGYPVLGMTDICSGIEFLLKNKWPENHYHLLASHAFALAQHHGLPTHLLDWTRKPRFAAFFAVDSNLRSCTSKQDSTEPPDLAVWAANLELIASDKDQYNTLRFLTCPRSEHSFLHVQDALFLWYPIADLSYLQKKAWPDFLEVVDKSYSDKQPKPIRQISLKGHEVDELYRKLLRLRISRAHLMPTYDNMVKTVEQSNIITDLELLARHVT